MTKKPLGVDICHSDSHAYIIRSDKGEYYRIGDITTNSDVTKYKLSISCSYGEHYLACGKNAFYVIRGDEYRKVNNLNQDGNPIVYKLHENCQGGDFYFALKTGWKSYSFYIIFLKKGVYRKVTNMNLDSNAVEYNLHDECKSGLYYWGNKGNACFLKHPNKWGLEFFQTNNLNLYTNQKRFSMHEDVMKLLMEVDEKPSSEKVIAEFKSTDGGEASVENKMCPPVESDHQGVDIAKDEFKNLSIGDDDAKEKRKKLSPVESFG